MDNSSYGLIVEGLGVFAPEIFSLEPRLGGFKESSSANLWASVKAIISLDFWVRASTADKNEFFTTGFSFFANGLLISHWSCCMLG